MVGCRCEFPLRSVGQRIGRRHTHRSRREWHRASSTQSRKHSFISERSSPNPGDQHFARWVRARPIEPVPHHTDARNNRQQDPLNSEIVEKTLVR